MDIGGLYPIQAMVASALLRHRRVLLMLPRQEGKTEIGVRINRAMLDTDKTRHTLFLAKSKKSAQKAAREKFQRLFEPELFKVNTENITNKKNPKAIGFIDSVDKDPDRIRGGTFHFIHWSEVAFSQLENGVTVDDVVQKILMPTLRRTNGFALLESTANGENGWKDIWDSAQEYLGAKTIRVSLSMLVTMGLVEIAEYERIKASTHPLVFRQEYECEWVSFAGLIYEEFDEQRHIEAFDLPDNLGQVGCAIDWGFIDSTCMLAGYRYKGKFWVFDEIYVNKTLLEQFAELFKSRIALWGAESLACVADHDPNRIAELHKRGIPCSNANKADVLGNRIQVKELLWNDKVRIHPRCKNLIRDLKAISWNKKTESKREDADYAECTWGHFDAEAAMRYLVRNLSDVSETVDDEIDFTQGQKAGAI
jgi:hypothetical protein